jgi:hypothetical protein
MARSDFLRAFFVLKTHGKVSAKKYGPVLTWITQHNICSWSKLLQILFFPRMFLLTTALGSK